MRIRAKRKTPPHAEHCKRLSKALNRPLSGREWSIIGQLHNKWGKDVVSSAITCFVKKDDSEKYSYMIPYLHTVCRNIDIERRKGEGVKLPIDLIREGHFKGFDGI